MPQSGARPATIRDVARLAGVAFTTAAAALRGEPVSDATRQRVEAAASSLGYKRNLAASLLASRARKRATGTISIAFVTAGMGRPLTHDPFKALPSLESEATKRGMLLRRHLVQDEKEAVRLGRLLTRRGVDGLIVRLADPARFLESFPLDSFCVVSLDQSLQRLGIDVVLGNHFHAVLELLREVRARGHRRIGVILRHHTPRLPDDDQRRGATLAFRHEAAPACALDVFEHPFGPIAPAQLGDWLARFNPDAVVGFNRTDLDLVAKSGRKVPRDLAFAGMVIEPASQPGVAGVLLDQHQTIPLTLETLEEKVRMHQRGLRPSAKQIVAHLPFVDGPSLPARA